MHCDTEPGQLMSRQAARPGQARPRSEVSPVEQDGTGPGRDSWGGCRVQHEVTEL